MPELPLVNIRSNDLQRVVGGTLRETFGRVSRGFANTVDSGVDRAFGRDSGWRDMDCTSRATLVGAAVNVGFAVTGRFLPNVGLLGVAVGGTAAMVAYNEGCKANQGKR